MMFLHLKIPAGSRPRSARIPTRTEAIPTREPIPEVAATRAALTRARGPVAAAMPVAVAIPVAAMPAAAVAAMPVAAVAAMPVAAMRAGVVEIEAETPVAAAIAGTESRGRVDLWFARTRDGQWGIAIPRSAQPPWLRFPFNAGDAL